MQVLKDSKVKFASVVGVHLLTSFWICFWFCISSTTRGWFVQLLATPPVSPLPASRGSFCYNLEGGASVSPLPAAVQSSVKIVGVFPLPLHFPS